MITVGLVDDQPLIRAGLRMILESQPDLSVAGEGEDGAQAVDLARATKPDVMLIDVRMPGIGGIEAIAGVLSVSPGTRIVILTTFDVDNYVYDALRAGASGFLVKDVSPEQLIAGVRSVVNGDMLIAPSITRRLVEGYVRRAPPNRDGKNFESLTEREREVLTEIAHELRRRRRHKVQRSDDLPSGRIQTVRATHQDRPRRCPMEPRLALNSHLGHSAKQWRESCRRRVSRSHCRRYLPAGVV